ncbi:hypothetical protein [Gordonia sp. (in: high G+C Gram-positive bacteria)]|jgi:hypothetical protein|uniref:hypothetical protein n=1 Tax=Gordonia sp. (in: high G+C Gram-positive bacteria) TaxID=84139 RepID=UPI001D5D2ABE|nr:hypothetical protein [Gordonia sp. (in: high G+C Gram-positive bacteria)]MCB1296765.1 hypothetical protein [Gordonia sp. (in: high G+C Gram-positive bacteria)]HMS74675.1 hypothetical protein [Gordonia sp. (in: high G+C Gram-positive bacteria)]HQV17643.1 hypothetical protein [Gordonia sp. (in: high G+C Gram-positive bacteria)]
MNNQNPEVTREGITERLVCKADDPATVEEIVHAGFNADSHSGGLAFVSDRRLSIFAYGGSLDYSVDPGNRDDRVAAIEGFWRRQQYKNRPLALADVSDYHRAAIAALEADAAGIDELPAQDRYGVTDIALGNYVYVLLRRRAAEPTADSALRALAADDSLLNLGENDRPPYPCHPCPVCGRLAIGRVWQYLSVCEDCYDKSICENGRPVAGYNESWLGTGFKAVHLDDRSTCEQTTREGRVWIDGIECAIGEAKFGGVYIGVEDTPASSPYGE